MAELAIPHDEATSILTTGYDRDAMSGQSYTTNLPLNELAVTFGTLQSANVATERSTGQSKDFGFLEFGT